jgi:hypothetical protein
MRIDFDQHAAGTATINPFAPLAFMVSFPLVLLHATSSLACAHKKLRASEHSAPGACLWFPRMANVKLDAMSALLALAPFMEVFK